jgi:N-acetylglucosamine kinase-like BadF-type ATPase
VHFRAACFGMSGGPEDKEGLLREVVDAEHWLVTHDGLIALSGALAGEDGIVAIAGTGSIAFGRKGDRTMRAGGWGYVFGDEGGAFWIVREALRAALRQEEGWGWNTRLRDILLQATGKTTANQVLHLFYTPEWPRSRVARLAASVASAAIDGDEAASTILQIAGGKLSQFVSAIQAALWAPGEIAPASYIGGVFRSPDVLGSFKDALVSTGKLVVRPPVWGADAGALIEAYRLAGIRPSLRER